MVVTYIYHSGYAIEFDDFSILIDFHSDVKRMKRRIGKRLLVG